MKQTSIILLAVAAIMFSCQGRKHDVVYYQQMVDSIQKAEQTEQLKEMQRRAGIYADPAEAFFDTLSYHSLPIQSETGASVEGSMIDVPMMLNGHFGFTDHARLRALRLPTAWRRQVVMVSETSDTVAHARYLFVMSDKHQPLDYLRIGEERREAKNGVSVRSFVEYFITSRYEITLMHYSQADGAPQPKLEQMRRYVITRDGKFEEVIIEL